jgi:hypothetical protein
MRDGDEARPVKNSEPVIPLGPSVYTGPTGHASEAGTAGNVTTAPAGPCVYMPAPGYGSFTTRAKATRPGPVPAKTIYDPTPS